MLCARYLQIDCSENAKYEQKGKKNELLLEINTCLYVAAANSLKM